MTAESSAAELTQSVEQHSEAVNRLFAEVRKVVVGQQTMVERLIIGLLTGGHVLLEGVPGLAKTLTVSTLAQALHASFSRIQFTPDLLPADLVGTLIYNPNDHTFTPRKGPVFANIVLADEINRAPAKVQSALLEAMQEKQVTIGDTTYPLPQPFLVLATQNPIEQEGTYPLPEAQVDRFMLKIRIGYPTDADEMEILERMGTSRPKVAVDPVVTLGEIGEARSLCDRLHVEQAVKDYIIRLVQATREPARMLPTGGAELGTLIEFGASPRASIALLLAARAHAFLQGQPYVSPADVKAIALDVLRHRVIASYEAQAEDLDSDAIVRRILDTLPIDARG